LKSVLNAAALRHMNTVKDKMGEQALTQAAQAIRLRSEDSPVPPSSAAGDAAPRALPSLGDAPEIRSYEGQPLGSNLAVKRVGNLLFMSGVVAFDPAAKKVMASYADLPLQARTSLRALGYDTGQPSVDIFEAPIVVQSWFVLNRIRELAQEHGAGMDDVFKLVQYFRDLRHYPAYNRVRQLFCPQGVVSTVVEVSAMLPSADVLIEVEATALLT
jgi:2-iminobutanoate/2-iminopropanoate deaminase